MKDQILTASILGLLAATNPAEAQDGVYAPGASGDIPSDFIEALDRAETLSLEWQEKLRVQQPAKWDLPIDLDEARRNALNHPRVRALLGTDTHEVETETAQQKWDSATVFAFASFSMPKSALRDLLAQGQDYGVPVVFRGFLNNSVYDTRDALIDIFGSDEAIEGFVIDPTLFARFKVSAVPVFVATEGALDACETAACEKDPIPPHDRLAGNVTLPYALELFERGGGEGSLVAGDVLERTGQ